MAKYKAYPEYKDSGVEWLGAIPSSWDMWKLSHAYEAIGSGTTPTSSNEFWFQGDIPWVTTGELRETVINDTFKKVSSFTLQTFSALKIHPAGSIVIAMYGATIGRLGVLGVDATTNQACCVMTRSNVVNNHYLYYWLQAFREDIIRLSSGGGQPNINQEKVASLKVSSPGWNDQATIVSFLEHETAKIDNLIDNLIEKQQQLIELLKEKRQAVISHAVTKGLNLDVPMKDSGVEGLGEVPEHWMRATPIKYLSSLKGRLGWQGLKADEYKDEGPYVVSSAHFNNYEIDWNSCPRVSLERYNLDSNIQLDVGDILLMKDGAAMGKLSYVESLPGKACLNSHLLLFRPLFNDEEKTYHTKFMFYLMRTEHLQSFIKTNGTGSTFLGISQQAIGNHSLCLPSFSEQEEISNYLDDELSKIDKLEAIQLEMKNLLTERRTALISAAVTGKIDVRNWTAPALHKVEAFEEVAA